MRKVLVAKVGGSLLNWPQLPAAIAQFAAANQHAQIVFIAGGGPFADVIRTADETFELGEERSHDLCVELLGVTSRLLFNLLNDFRWIDQWETLTTLKVGSPVVFNPVSFLQDIEPAHAGALPRNWAVTTDSIAARIAELLPADELVLLKSAEPQFATMQELTQTGYVDAYFPTACKLLKHVRFENLRRAL